MHLRRKQEYKSCRNRFEIHLDNTFKGNVFTEIESSIKNLLVIHNIIKYSYDFFVHNYTHLLISILYILRWTLKGVCSDRFFDSHIREFDNNWKPIFSHYPVKFKAKSMWCSVEMSEKAGNYWTILYTRNHTPCVALKKTLLWPGHSRTKLLSEAIPFIIFNQTVLMMLCYYID